MFHFLKLLVTRDAFQSELLCFISNADTIAFISDQTCTLCVQTYCSHLCKYDYDLCTSYMPLSICKKHLRLIIDGTLAAPSDRLVINNNLIFDNWRSFGAIDQFSSTHGNDKRRLGSIGQTVVSWWHRFSWKVIELLPHRVMSGGSKTYKVSTRPEPRRH